MENNQEKQQERRRHQRVATDFTGTLHGDGETSCQVLNISRSGAYAVSTAPLPEMAQVKICLQVHEAGGEKKALSCEAAVVRCDQRPDGRYDLGLFFTSLSKEDHELLQSIIASQAFSLQT